MPPTPLWEDPSSLTSLASEQAIAVAIDNSSVFIPGGGAPQYGFRRTDIIAQPSDGDHAALDAEIEVGTTVFHFSVKSDEERPLNYTHEYQVVFIEPDDGTHVFELQLGKGM